MAKNKKSKKAKSLYDENGRWVEERGRIKGAIRRAFRLSPQMKEVLQSARVELPPALKKDGTPGKRPRVRYRCADCGELFPQKRVQVDHIETVVPLWKREADMTYDEIVRGVFCSISNLQVLCSTPMNKNNGFASCHQKKTNEEKFIRTKLVPIMARESVFNGEVLPRELGSPGFNVDKEILKLKEEFIAYQAEKEEKVRKKNERKALREKKEAERIKELKNNQK